MPGICRIFSDVESACGDNVQSCAGYLRGFDRHMNLILWDTDEQYTVRLRVERSKVVGVPASEKDGGEDPDAQQGEAFPENTSVVLQPSDDLLMKNYSLRQVACMQMASQ